MGAFLAEPPITLNHAGCPLLLVCCPLFLAELSNLGSHCVMRALLEATLAFTLLSCTLCWKQSLHSHIPTSVDQS